jgi:hypothetical protein
MCSAPTAPRLVSDRTSAAAKAALGYLQKFLIIPKESCTQIHSVGGPLVSRRSPVTSLRRVLLQVLRNIAAASSAGNFSSSPKI